MKFVFVFFWNGRNRVHRFEDLGSLIFPVVVSNHRVREKLIGRVGTTSTWIPFHKIILDTKVAIIEELNLIGKERCVRVLEKQIWLSVQGLHCRIKLYSKMKNIKNFFILQKAMTKKISFSATAKNTFFNDRKE